MNIPEEFLENRTCRFMIANEVCGKPGVWIIGKTVEDATIVCDNHRRAVTMHGDNIIPIEKWFNHDSS